MEPEFSTTGETLHIRDRIERIDVAITADRALAPSPTDTDFTYPVDAAVSVTATTLTVDRPLSVVFDGSGQKLRVLVDDGTETFDPGTYYLKVADDLKTYVRVDATDSFRVETTTNTNTVTFSSPTTVDVGARTSATQPAATITATTAPEDLAVAISHLGAALKDTGPMRSYPSLRGHPPTIELGDELDVPDDLTPPDTGVTIVVPFDYDHLFPVAPLAYYLGARIEPGPEPRIETDTGFTHSLAAPCGFEETVARVLKQVFVLDTVVRSAGPYGPRLTMLSDDRETTGIDPDELYDRPLAEQLETYLAVPWKAVAPFVPRWSSTAYVEYTPDHVPYLPFLVDDLAIVRTPAIAERRTVTDAPTHATADGFTRTTTTDATPSMGGPATDTIEPGPTTDPDPPAPFADPEFRATLDADDIPATPGPLDPPNPLQPDVPDTRSADDTTAVVPEPTRAQNTLWLADGTPIGTTTPTIEAYHHALDRDPVDEIEVLVVCNDPRMAAEDQAVRRLLSAETGFDVRVRPFRALQTDELAELLRRGADFLHFIGHIDEDGFVCPDGHLDAASLDEVNVDACFLNACRSSAQGHALVDAGAIASIVTLTDVLNADAVSVGTTMARLLNNGYPLAAALDLAAESHAVDDYTLIGDGRVQVAENPQGAVFLDAETTSDGVQVSVTVHHSPQADLGSAYSSLLDELDGWYLNGIDATGCVSTDALDTYLADSDHPVRYDGRFGWSTEWRP